ncbi:MAG TPA: IPT/TIG domain-containing protein [Puia sp.]|nr:IPT/TIG domain-containing protein [Puia sp.]
MIINPKQLPKRSILKFVVSICISITLIIGCKKDSGSLEPAPTPPSGPSLIVTSMSPSFGPDSTLVTFRGKGFGTITANDSVSFNGRMASVISVNDAVIVARVPTLAGSGNVVVSINGVPLQAGNFYYDTTYHSSVIAGEIRSPWYVAVDDSSNVYYSNYNDGTINKIDSLGHQSIFKQSLNAMGLAFDKAGNLFVASDIGGGPFIDRINPDGSVTQIAKDSGALFGLAVDKDGNIYTANIGTNSVDKITPQGVVTVLASGLFSVSDITVGKDGSVYALHYSGNTYTSYNGVVSKISPSGQVSTLAVGIYYSGEAGLVVDSNDNVYVTSLNQGLITSSILKITPSGAVKTVSTDVSFPIGIAIDHNGNLYVANNQMSRDPGAYGELAKLTPH